LNVKKQNLKGSHKAAASLACCLAAAVQVKEGYSNIVKEYELEEGHVLSVELQGICNDPNALKTLARDLLTGLDYLHK
jgi:hypothetical protein